MTHSGVLIEIQAVYHGIQGHPGWNFSSFQPYFLLHMLSAPSVLEACPALPGACHPLSCHTSAHPLFSLWTGFGFPFSLLIEILPKFSVGFKGLACTTIRASVSFCLVLELHILISFFTGWFILFLKGSTSFLFLSSTHRAVFCK